MKSIIKVENVSKQYHLGGVGGGNITFRETLARAISGRIRRSRETRSSKTETLWALKDINFEVERGGVVGIIGNNGAGKSTLLKVVSHITAPTTGRTEVYGRIGNLLEVGTGFHPDLTGRENIFLNGAILGMRRVEIARRFDEIVAFSEIEKFIDTPVKWYSSGMYLRLAFSVAVHLETEVLIMDEVLAVGDISFQQRCVEKMHEIRSQGRTILFVSHSMAAVTRLCPRVILLDKGCIVDDGPAHQIVNRYLNSSRHLTAEHQWLKVDESPGNEIVRLRRVRVRNEGGRTSEQIDIRRPVGIELSYEVLQPGHVIFGKIDLLNQDGAHLFAAHDVVADREAKACPVGHHVSTAWIPGNFLSEGGFLVNVYLVSHLPTSTLYAHAPKALTFQVVDNQGSDSARGNYRGPITGLVRPLLSWSTSFNSGANPELTASN